MIFHSHFCPVGTKQSRVVVVLLDKDSEIDAHSRAKSFKVTANHSSYVMVKLKITNGPRTKTPRIPNANS